MTKLRCVVTRYRLVQVPEPLLTGSHVQLVEASREEATGWHVSQPTAAVTWVGEEMGVDYGVAPEPYLYLHNSAASTPLAGLLERARQGQGWSAQAGTPPVYVEGAGWGGRNWPKIYVHAAALLELEAEFIKEATPQK